MGNVVNRVFDSSGPEGKVRGTPQQIIEKYNQLARDAQLSNDRVAAENFQQHAEHYTRMLAEAMKEQQERQQQGGNPNYNQQNGAGNQGGGGNDGRQQHQPNQQRRQQQDDGDDRNDSPRAERFEPPQGRQDDVIDVSATEDSPLVETPENRPNRPRRTRRKAEGAEQPTDASQDAAE
jgi:hypothetical protein